MKNSRRAIGITAGQADGPLAIGTTYRFSKTVGETDVYLFAGITGDFSPNHINEEYMARTPYKRRVAHGVLTVGYMSACSTLAISALGGVPAVSYGYDRIRFTAPVFIGDTVEVTYTIASREDSRGRIVADVVVRNQRDVVVAVATHILQLV